MKEQGKGSLRFVDNATLKMKLVSRIFLLRMDTGLSFLFFWGRFHQHFRAQYSIPFLANGNWWMAQGVWWMAHGIWQIFSHLSGNFSYSLWGRMLVKLNGEFFAKRRAPVSFCLAKKFGEIDPWSLFCVEGVKVWHWKVWNVFWQRLQFEHELY